LVCIYAVIYIGIPGKLNEKPLESYFHECIKKKKKRKENPGIASPREIKTTKLFKDTKYLDENWPMYHVLVFPFSNPLSHY
jgi:hypothetical protein